MERIDLEFYSNRKRNQAEDIRKRDIMNLEAQLHAALSKEIYSAMAGVNRLFDDIQGHNRHVEMVKNIIHPRWLAEDEDFFDSCYRQAFNKHPKRSAKREGKILPVRYRVTGHQQTVRKAVANMPNLR